MARKEHDEVSLQVGSQQQQRLTIEKKSSGGVVGDGSSDDRIVTDINSERSLMEQFGTREPDFARGIIRQLRTICSKDRGIDAGKFSFLLALIKDGKPVDQTDTLLLVQLGIVHLAVTDYGARLERAENLHQLEYYQRALSTLVRTFSGLSDARKRHRGGGEQRVVVHHVPVSRRGEAIVGRVERGTNDALLGQHEAPIKQQVEDPASSATALTLVEEMYGQRARS